MDLRDKYRKLRLYQQKSDCHAKKHLCGKCHINTEPLSTCKFFRQAELRFKDKNNFWWNEDEINEGNLIIAEITVIRANCSLITDIETVKNG